MFVSGHSLKRLKRMEPFTVQHGIVMPLNRINVNTDDIIPAKYLTTVSRTGYAHALFMNWRYLGNTMQPNAEFELNMPRYQGATILLAGDNFGCGSSREHAPWALTQFGFRAVISTSFADIFKQNSLKNSLLPIVVPADVHEELFGAAADAVVAIDLASQTLTTPAGRAVVFPVDSFSKHCLLAGVDELGYILDHEAQIAAY